MPAGWLLIQDAPAFVALSHGGPTDAHPTSPCVSLRRWRHRVSGFTVVLASVPESPLTSVQIVVPTLPSDNAGIPHCLEHLCFMGTKDTPRGVLDRAAIACVSHGTNAWTDDDHTCYTFDGASEEGVLRLLPLFLDHVWNPKLSSASFLTEVHHVDGKGKDQGVVFQEMLGRETTESDLRERAVKEALFPNTSLIYDAGGLTPEIAELTVERVRGFHQQHYRLHRMICIVTGPIDMSNAPPTVSAEGGGDSVPFTEEGLLELFGKLVMPQHLREERRGRKSEQQLSPCPSVEKEDSAAPTSPLMNGSSATPAGKVSVATSSVPSVHRRETLRRFIPQNSRKRTKANDIDASTTHRGAGEEDDAATHNPLHLWREDKLFAGDHGIGSVVVGMSTDVVLVGLKSWLRDARDGKACDPQLQPIVSLMMSMYTSQLASKQRWLSDEVAAMHLPDATVDILRKRWTTALEEEIIGTVALDWMRTFLAVLFQLLSTSGSCPLSHALCQSAPPLCTSVNYTTFEMMNTRHLDGRETMPVMTALAFYLEGVAELEGPSLQPEKSRAAFLSDVSGTPVYRKNTESASQGHEAHAAAHDDAGYEEDNAEAALDALWETLVQVCEALEGHGAAPPSGNDTAGGIQAILNKLQDADHVWRYVAQSQEYRIAAFDEGAVQYVASQLVGADLLNSPMASPSELQRLLQQQLSTISGDADARVEDMTWPRALLPPADVQWDGQGIETLCMTDAASSSKSALRTGLKAALAQVLRWLLDSTVDATTNKPSSSDASIAEGQPPVVCAIAMRPSAAYEQNNERKRLARQRMLQRRLGESGLRKRQEILDCAVEDTKPIPEGALPSEWHRVSVVPPMPLEHFTTAAMFQRDLTELDAPGAPTVTLLATETASSAGLVRVAFCFDSEAGDANWGDAELVSYLGGRRLRIPAFLLQALLFECDITGSTDEAFLAASHLPPSSDGSMTYQEVSAVTDDLCVSYGMTTGLAQSVVLDPYLQPHWVEVSTTSTQEKAAAAVVFAMTTAMTTKLTLERLAVMLGKWHVELQQVVRDGDSMNNHATDLLTTMLSSHGAYGSDEPECRKRHGFNRCFVRHSCLGWVDTVRRWNDVLSRAVMPVGGDDGDGSNSESEEDEEESSRHEDASSDGSEGGGAKADAVGEAQQLLAMFQGALDAMVRQLKVVHVLGNSAATCQRLATLAFDTWLNLRGEGADTPYLAVPSEAIPARIASTLDSFTAVPPPVTPKAAVKSHPSAWGIPRWVVVEDKGMDSSVVKLRFGPFPQAWKGNSVQAVSMVAWCDYLSISDGPLFTAVRGEGLAYGASLVYGTGDGWADLSIDSAADPAAAITACVNVIMTHCFRIVQLTQQQGGGEDEDYQRGLAYTKASLLYGVATTFASPSEFHFAVVNHLIRHAGPSTAVASHPAASTSKTGGGAEATYVKVGETKLAAARIDRFQKITVEDMSAAAAVLLQFIVAGQLVSSGGPPQVSPFVAVVVLGSSRKAGPLINGTGGVSFFEALLGPSRQRVLDHLSKNASPAKSRVPATSKTSWKTYTVKEFLSDASKLHV